MRDLPRYLVIDCDTAPEVFVKVLEVKRLLATGKAHSVNDAVRQASLSRSAFYKYKDKVYPFNEKLSGKIITISALLQDEPGVLSHLTGELYKGGANILTINQNIPVNETAPVSITARIDEMNVDIDDLLGYLRSCNGVKSIDIISGY